MGSGAGKRFRVRHLIALGGVAGLLAAVLALLWSLDIQGRRLLAVLAGSALLLALLLATGLLAKRSAQRRFQRQLEQERERERRRLVERSDELMRQANDIILLLDPDGRVLEANERATEFYGYSNSELCSMAGGNLRSPRATGSFQEQWQLLLADGGGLWEALHRRKDGSDVPVEVSARLIRLGGEPCALTFLRDISERQAQAREIQRLTHLYQAQSQVGQAIVRSRDRAALFARICEVLVEFGTFPLAAVACPDWKGPGVLALSPAGAVLDPGDADLVAAALAEGQPRIRTGRHGQAGSAAAFPVHEVGGRTCALVVHAESDDFFGAGEVALLLETASEVAYALDNLREEARRARAEEALSSAKAFTENLIQTANVMIVSLDAQGEIEIYNDAAVAITGYRRDQLIGRNWFEVLTPRERYPQVWEEFNRIMGGGLAHQFENPILTRDGQERIISWQNNEIRTGDRITGTLSFGIDITAQRQGAEEQRRLELQLQQSQKMESLGSLAGGVAHDLNNVLGAILSLASSQQEEPDLPPRLRTSLDTVVSACLRGRGVIKSLLYFARKDLDEVRPIDLNALVKDMVQLLAYTTLKRVNLDMDLEQPLARIQGDGGALSHALMNLCVNAVDAMPGGGNLTLRTRRTASGDLELAVQDDGAGMSPEVLAKAMEPFFTTKPVGKGTGLGLAMVFGTMKAHGGTLELRSEVGVGTEALLRFPAERVLAPAPAEPAGLVPAAATQPSLSILLVDDDELIRASVGPMLELLGHQVHLAAGGQEALDLLGTGLEVDLVILDMNMPGLNGAETLPLIQALRPRQAVLLASGYSDQDIGHLVLDQPDLRSLRKPFTLAELRASLSEILASRCAPGSAPSQVMGPYIL